MQIISTVLLLCLRRSAYKKERIIGLQLTEICKTVKNIKERKAFIFSVADSEYVVEADCFGGVSGNNMPINLKIVD